MSLKKILSTTTILLFAVAMSASGFGAMLFNEGSVDARLDKQAIGQGESLKGAFEIANFGESAFNDAYIVAEVIAGKKGAIGYPSQFSDNGTIILEKKFEARLLGKDKREIRFEISLPKSLRPGTYSLDYYYVANRAPVSGIPHIFASPKSAEFTVEGAQGQQGEFPQVSILRTKTVFNGQAGPVGPPAQPGSSIPGEVFVTNLTQKEQKGIVVWAGLCAWDDTACTGFLSEDSKAIDIAAGGEGKAALTLKAPEIPGAYAIRIEARSASGEVISIYRNRSIVVGGTAIIKKMEVQPQGPEAGKTVEVRVLLGASPDHYTFPDFRDFDLVVWAEKSGQNIFSEKMHFDILKSDEVEKDLSFQFTPSTGADNYKLCSSVEKGKVMDRYCVDIAPLQRFYSPEDEDGAKIKVEHSFDRASESLAINVCGFDANGNADTLDIEAMLVEADSGKVVLSSKVSEGTCYSESAKAGPLIYLLAVDDLKNGKQDSREIDLREKKASCESFGGLVCESDKACFGRQADSLQGTCCIGECRTQSGNKGTVIESGSGEELDWGVAALGLAGILMLAAGFLLSLKRKNGGSVEKEGDYSA